MSTCVDCGRDFPEDRFNRELVCADSCFSCRSKGISLALQGGKSYWHDDTEKRRADTAIAEGKAAGFDPVPVRTASVSISASALKAAPGIANSHGAFGGSNASAPNKVATPKVKVGS